MASQKTLFGLAAPKATHVTKAHATRLQRGQSPRGKAARIPVEKPVVKKPRAGPPSSGPAAKQTEGQPAATKRSVWAPFPTKPVRDERPAQDQGDATSGPTNLKAEPPADAALPQPPAGTCAPTTVPQPEAATSAQLSLARAPPTLKQPLSSVAAARPMPKQALTSVAADSLCPQR